MTRNIAICLIIALIVLVLVATLAAPRLLSDENAFVRDLMEGQLIGFLGVIVTITLASAAQLHLTFNKIEEKYKVRGALAKTRKTVKEGAYGMIWLLAVAVVLMVAKPLLPTSQWVQSLMNGAGVVVVVVTILILIDLTQLVFQIEPEIED